MSHLEQRGSYTWLLFGNFSAAFNTILSKRLVSKLSQLGISDSVCCWIRHFLTDRSQRVRVGLVFGIGWSPHVEPEEDKQTKNAGQCCSHVWALGAIHTDVMESMDSSSFINALRRFFAVRAPAKQLRSDSVSNFVGACKRKGYKSIWVTVDALGCSTLLTHITWVVVGNVWSEFQDESLNLCYKNFDL